MDGSWPPRPDARYFLLLFSGLAILLLLSSVGTGVEPFAATGARAIPLLSLLALSPLDFPKLPAFARAIAALNASASTAACPTAWRTAGAALGAGARPGMTENSEVSRLAVSSVMDFGAVSGEAATLSEWSGRIRTAGPTR